MKSKHMALMLPVLACTRQDFWLRISIRSDAGKSVEEHICFKELISHNYATIHTINVLTQHHIPLLQATPGT